jgi:hypothetical protein
MVTNDPKLGAWLKMNSRSHTPLKEQLNFKQDVGFPGGRAGAEPTSVFEKELLIYFLIKRSNN